MLTPRVDPFNVLDLSNYLPMLRRYAAWLIAGLLIGLAGGAAFALLSGESYSSSAEVEVDTVTPNVAGDGLESGSGVNMTTEEQLASSTGVADAVRANLKSNRSAGKLLAHLDVTSYAKSNVLRLTFADDRPEVARTTAQAFADAYLADRRRNAQRQIDGLQKSLSSRLATLESQLVAVQATLATAARGSTESVTATAQQSVLTAQVAPLRTKLDSLETLVVNPGSVIVPATKGDKVSYGLFMPVLLGGLIGLGLAAAAAFAHHHFDDSLHSARDVERVGLPVFGTIPPRGTREASTVLQPAEWSPEKRKAYGRLVARVLVAARRRQLRVLTVTGPTDSAADELVAANLAVALTAAGQTVTLVRASSVGRYREHSLVGAGGPSTDTSGEPTVLLTPLEGLGVMALSGADSTDAKPITLDAARSLVSDLSNAVDFVVIAAPPVLTAGDAMVLSSVADGVILVAEQGSECAELAEAGDLLVQVGARTLGAVVAEC